MKAPARIFARPFLIWVWGWLWVWAGIGVGLATALPARAADSAFTDIQRIIDAGVLRVAMLSRDVPPMIMTAEDGTATGFEPDLARDLAEKLGVEVELIRTARTYNAVVDQVAAKQADLGISFLSSGVSRALNVYFSRPYIDQDGLVFYNRTAFAKLKHEFKVETIQELAKGPALDALQVGALKGSVYQTTLERDFPRVRIKLFANLADLMQAVRNNEVFAGLHGGLQTRFYMYRYPSTAIHVAIDRQSRLNSDICIAVRPDAPNLLRWVDVYLANRVGLEDSQAIITRYAEAFLRAEEEAEAAQ